MRLLCVIDSLGSGGAQRQIVELAKGFNEEGIDVSFLIYHKEYFFAKDLIHLGIEIHCIEESNYLWRILKMRKFIRSGGFDIVLSFLEGANLICEISALPSKRWKLIVGERSANPNILKSRKLKLYRWMHIFADFIVANSYENLKLVKQAAPFINAKKIKVIYNLVDYSFGNNLPHIRKNNLKFKLTIAASHQYLKNARGLISAVNLLPIEYQKQIEINWYGEISPDNSFQDALQLVKAYNLENVIRFHKPIKDIKNIMIESDAIGLFSLYEGLPNSICEAMILGKPVICSKVSDVTELLNHCPQCLFNPENPNEISYSITFLLSQSTDSLNKIGIVNKLKAEQLFNKEEIIVSYLQLFNYENSR